MVSHARWKLTQDRKAAESLAASPDTARMREEIRIAWDFGQAVHDRRTALGISQTELARRAGMTQPQVSKLELAGTVPTLPLLARLARALESTLTVEFQGETCRATFTPDADTDTDADTADTADTAQAAAATQ
jgi:transcriptional regulator with XRE-family HTH domain